jgi:tetratricopeptide (TPR) repeat protein
MSNDHSTIRILRLSVEMAKERPLDAIALLDQEITRLRDLGQFDACIRLAKHGGVVATGEAQFARALKYYELARAHDPTNVMIHLAVGDVELRLGQRASAKASFLRALELSVAQHDESLIELASTALARI